MNWFIVFLFFSFWSPTHSAKHTEKTSGSILVRTHDLRSSKGRWHIALYSKPDNFLSRTIFPPGYVADISNKTAQKMIENLPPGKYAISVYHDENANNKTDFNAIGLPNEGIGMSNNPTIYFSAPDYESCAFIVKAGQTTTIDIKMKYYF